MDGKVKTRGTSSVPNTLGRQFGILPVGNPPVRPRRPKPSNSYALPVSGRTRGGPPSPHSSRNQILNSKEPLLQGASYSSGIEDDGIKFVDVPKDRKLIGQRRPLSGSARHRRPSSGTAQKDEHHGSASSQRDTPNDLDDDEVFHPYKTISQQEILEANHERDPEKIYEINLYASDLTKINNLQKFKKLRVLDLSCNYIPKIENLNENGDIRELKLYGNRIQQMENLTSLRELSNLQLQHNKIKTIGKSLSQCTKIKTLNLSSNHIMKIDSSELSCCSHLTVLDLSSNLLDNLSVVNYLPNLEELNISGNRLRTVDFNRCKKLQDIDLSGNEVKDISGLKGMACLQILNVSNNRIVSFKSVGKLKSLTELHAAENHISEVSLMPNLFPQLEILNISRNYITSFEEVCTLNNLEELSELFISGNPFSNDDGVHISYMADIQSEFHNLDILDGALLKRSASKGAPLMRPMSVSTIITARQVESQMKQMDSEMKSLEDDISKRFDFLRSTLDRLPSQHPDSSRSSQQSVSGSHNFVKSSSHSRIRDALKFAATAENLDDTKK